MGQYKLPSIFYTFSYRFLTSMKPSRGFVSNNRYNAGTAVYFVVCHLLLGKTKVQVMPHCLQLEKVGGQELHWVQNDSVIERMR